MVPVRAYKTYFLTYLQRDPRITRVDFVIKESHLAKIIKEVKATDIMLAVVIPSADATAFDEDNLGDNNSGLIYVLKPAGRSTDTDSKMIDRIETTQLVIENIKALMLVDKTHHELGFCPNFMTELDINSMHTDPEYDFLGCDGWSLSFNFKTNGF